MDRHTLFLLTPAFFDGEEGPCFCPHSAAMEGLLGYVPELTSSMDVHLSRYLSRELGTIRPH